jgi:hypothetical protein
VASDIIELIKLMNWDQHTCICLIKGMIRDERITFNNSYQSYEDLITHLKKQTYVQEDAMVYLERLMQIKQKNYVWINDHSKEIQECVENYAISNNLTKKEIKRKFEESFIYGLATEVKIEKKKLNIDKAKAIIKHITDIEKILKEEMKVKQSNKIRYESLNHDNSRKENSKHKDPFFKQGIPRKWCKIHQTATHDLK